MVLMVADPMPPYDGAVGWHIMGYWLSWISMFINPFVYFTTNDFFKTATIKTFANENFVNLSTRRNTTIAEQEGWFATVGKNRSGRSIKVNVELESQDIL